MNPMLLLTSLMLAVPTVLDEPAPAFELYTSSEGHYAILLPGHPTEKRVLHDSPVGRVEVVMVTASVGEEAFYSALHADMPPGSMDGDLEARLDGARDGALGRVGGRLVSERPVRLGSYPGREILFEVGVPASQARIVMRTFLVGDRIYTIQALVLAGRADAEAVAGFLDSFRLLDKPAEAVPAEPRPSAPGFVPESLPGPAEGRSAT